MGGRSGSEVSTRRRRRGRRFGRSCRRRRAPGRPGLRRRLRRRLGRLRGGGQRGRIDGLRGGKLDLRLRNGKRCRRRLRGGRDDRRRRGRRGLGGLPLIPDYAAAQPKAPNRDQDGRHSFHDSSSDGDRQAYKESRALPGFAGKIDCTIVQLHDPESHRQSDARAFFLGREIQAENLLAQLRRECRRRYRKCGFRPCRRRPAIRSAVRRPPAWPAWRSPPR